MITALFIRIEHEIHVSSEITARESAARIFSPIHRYSPRNMNETIDGFLVCVSIAKHKIHHYQPEKVYSNDIMHIIYSSSPE